jgi:hypothetical protein
MWPLDAGFRRHDGGGVEASRLSFVGLMAVGEEALPLFCGVHAPDDSTSLFRHPGESLAFAGVRGHMFDTHHAPCFVIPEKTPRRKAASRTPLLALDASSDLIP